MATPKVKLRTLKATDGSTVYVLDDRVNGKRIRKKVGPNKHDAELVRSKTEHDLLFGQYQIQAEKPQVTLGEPVQQFLDPRNSRSGTRHTHATRTTWIHLSPFSIVPFPLPPATLP